MQKVILIYDIVEDRVRTKVADTCLDYGLDRIQFSAFFGQLRRNKQEELMLRIAELMAEATGHVKLIPVCDPDWNKCLEVNHA